VPGPNFVDFRVLASGNQTIVYNQDKDELSHKDEPSRAIQPLPLDTPLAAVATLPESPAEMPSLSRDIVKAATSSAPVTHQPGSRYKPPPLSILKKVSNARNTRMDKQIEDHARTLEHTLESFGHSGPCGARYAGTIRYPL